MRCVVFVQGCPLRCLYCHNPDTWNPAGGTEMTADAVVARVVRYKPYFGADGGVTLSGGEPLLQARFAAEVLRGCKAADIHTALDTSGQFLNEDVHACLDATDLVLLDIKHSDPRGHRDLVGRGLQAAVPAAAKPQNAASAAAEQEDAQLGDLSRTLAFLDEVTRRGIDLWVRQVIVPGITDSPQQIEALAALLRGRANLRKVELLPYHRLARSKWEALGVACPLADTPEPTPQHVAQLQSLLESLFR